MTILIPILDDQLSRQLASLRDVDAKDAVVLLMEIGEETTFVRHHQRKIALILSAMRHFAAELRDAGWTVDYVRLDGPDYQGNFTGEVNRAVKRHRATGIWIVEPGEWRAKTAIDSWADKCGVPVDVLADDHFICSILDYQTWAQTRNKVKMEYFYRDMRRKTGLLMTADGKPEGGQWNLDKENRAPPKCGLNYPEPIIIPNR
ncbi:MAG: cryptochrome/photolyase family protein [Sphingomicrobium sp.]